MISKKELQYVELWANKIPMPGEEYSLAVLDDIEKCYKLYQEKYKDKEYTFLFSNAEEIAFEILSKNLCHMLGIDYKNISGEYFEDYREEVLGTLARLTSYELLEAILANKEKVAQADNDPRNKAKAINYYKSAIKTAIFTRFSDFEKFNFAGVNYEDDTELEKTDQKLLFVPSNESLFPYFFMGIQKDELSDKYFVKTLFAPENPREYFNMQEAFIPTQIIVDTQDALIKKCATPEEKLHLLTMYKNIINVYNLANRMNISADYEATLNDIANARVRKN